jgi:hypothetical protein
MKILFIAFLILGTAVKQYAQGYIVQNGVVAFPPVGTAYMFDVIQDPTIPDYTGFEFYGLGYQPNNVFTLDVVVDEGVRLFSVSQNSLISAQTISSGIYTEWTPTSAYTLENHIPFMLGLYTGRGGPVVYTDPVYGWVTLVNNNGAIQMLDSGIAYGSAGIYAGTLNFVNVPEPGTISLVALGLPLLWIFRKSGHKKA